MKLFFKLLKTGAQLAVLLLLCSIIMFQLYSIMITMRAAKTKLPKTFGNFDRVRNLLPAINNEEEMFSFAIVGDTRGNGTSERIYENLHDEPLAFMILLGDIVNKGTPEHHVHLRSEWSGEIKPTYPVFYAVGNHDVDQDNFSVEQFDKTYGPSIFSFNINGCLFVVLRILNPPYSHEESIEYLEKILTNERDKYRKIFVFMHVPLPVFVDLPGKKAEHAEKLIELINKFKVDYVIASDYHGYARENIKDTVYLVTGGGGAHLTRAKFGHFYHAMVIKVKGDTVVEKILQVDKDDDFEDAIEMAAITDVYPWLQNNKILAVFLNIGILILLVWLIKGIIKGGKSKLLNL
ncbi:MAG: metallophosphoesterase [bacterium]